MVIEDQVRVRHMIEAAETALHFVASRQRNELNSDRMLQFALIRAIEIIGEAASRVSDETRRISADIPWSAIVGMRNRLVRLFRRGR